MRVPNNEMPDALLQYDTVCNERTINHSHLRCSIVNGLLNLKGSGFENGIIKHKSERSDALLDFDYSKIVFVSGSRVYMLGKVSDDCDIIKNKAERLFSKNEIKVLKKYSFWNELIDNKERYSLQNCSSCGQPDPSPGCLNCQCSGGCRMDPDPDDPNPL